MALIVRVRKGKKDLVLPQLKFVDGKLFIFWN